MVKEPKQKESFLQRLNKATDTGTENGLPNNAVVITMLAIEIQSLNNRLEELEKNVAK